MISDAPWEIIDLRHQKNGQLKIQSKSSYRHIANVIARTPEATANAKMIAAAPILAAALRHILRLQEEHDGEPFEVPMMHAEQIARDALNET